MAVTHDLQTVNPAGSFHTSTGPLMKAMERQRASHFPIIHEGSKTHELWEIHFPPPSRYDRAIPFGCVRVQVAVSDLYPIHPQKKRGRRFSRRDILRTRPTALSTTFTVWPPHPELSTHKALLPAPDTRLWFPSNLWARLPSRFTFLL